MENYYVSLSGKDDNPGTRDKPFGTIAKGISMLKAGDVLNLREGSYIESVEVVGKHGTDMLPIMIRSYDGEHVTIDGSVVQFRHAPNDDWEPALLHDSHAHDDEYVSHCTFALDSPHDRVNLGAFVDREPYTRLITYSRLEDLRVSNQSFGKLPLDDALDGWEETDSAGNGTGFKRPKVYMGPGLFFSRDTGRIHIRLSHTSNNVEGLADYQGEVDPRKLRLAISHKDRTAFLVKESSFIRFENLSIRFGGETTLHIERTQNLVFDHVRILAATQGVHFVRNTDMVFSHCEVRGGMPSWLFRSDIKAQYYFKDGDVVVENRLGQKTSLTLLFGDHANSNIEIHYCEFLDAHDLYLFGQTTYFHHNWIHNLNDEALVIDEYKTQNLHIFQNVITQCLSAVSYSGGTVSGPTYIYRNLIDLRQPTAGVRPRPSGDQKVFRFGNIYKTHKIDGEVHLFQNTILVFRQPLDLASYKHYYNTQGANPRRSFNNIFVSINPESDFDQPIMLLPSPSFPGPTDGNCYFRIGSKTKPLFRFLGYSFTDPLEPALNCNNCEAGNFDNLTALRGDSTTNPVTEPSLLFKQSKSQYPPGYEAVSIAEDPLFRRIGGAGTSLFDSDDFRLGSLSPARGHGIELPPDLKVLDPLAPFQDQERPDIGCYVFDGPGLDVGVDGRRHFPLRPGEIFEDI